MQGLTRWTFAVSTLALASLASLAHAQNWPAKTITIVVPFPAGGTTDVLARAIGTKLSSAIGGAASREGHDDGDGFGGPVLRVGQAGRTSVLTAKVHRVRPCILVSLGEGMARTLCLLNANIRLNIESIIHINSTI